MGKKENPLLSYLHQKKTISKKHMEQKELGQDEYLSRFSRSDRLLPVITLILYCGEKPWDGAVRLHEMLDLSRLPEELKEYVEDYAVHILDVCRTPDERLREFPQESCFLLMVIKYAKDDKALLRLRELSGCADISEDTFETIEEYLDVPEILEYREDMEGEGGKINMMNGFRKFLQDERSEGIEQGIQQGIDQAKKAFRLSGEGLSVEEIARKLSISEDKVRRILE